LLREWTSFSACFVACFYPQPRATFLAFITAARIHQESGGVPPCLGSEGAELGAAT